MIRVSRILIAVPLFCSAAAPAPQPAPGTLVVEVQNIRVAKGIVHVDVCPEKQYLGDGCTWAASAPAQFGVTRVTITNLPPGRYAAQAFLDENKNDKVDQALFGIPKEGVGFSNDAKIGFGPPSFKATAFQYDGSPGIIRFKLRYFMGAKGPSPAR